MLKLTLVSMWDSSDHSNGVSVGIFFGLHGVFIIICMKWEELNGRCVHHHWFEGNILT